MNQDHEQTRMLSAEEILEVAGGADSTPANDIHVEISFGKDILVIQASANAYGVGWKHMAS